MNHRLILHSFSFSLRRLSLHSCFSDLSSNFFFARATERRKKPNYQHIEQEEEHQTNNLLSSNNNNHTKRSIEMSDSGGGGEPVSHFLFLSFTSVIAVIECFLLIIPQHPTSRPISNLEFVFDFAFSFRVLSSLSCYSKHQRLFKVGCTNVPSKD